MLITMISTDGYSVFQVGEVRSCRGGFSQKSGYMGNLSIKTRPQMYRIQTKIAIFAVSQSAQLNNGV
jgi:hypothetical protein